MTESVACRNLCLLVNALKFEMIDYSFECSIKIISKFQLAQFTIMNIT
jgi:hypothetical protein